jgi:hypothetical protein
LELIYSAGNRRRRGGYALDRGLPGRSTRLYDLADDPHETTNVADRSQHRENIERLREILVDHLRVTDCKPASARNGDDPRTVLDRGLLPREG